MIGEAADGSRLETCLGLPLRGRLNIYTCDADADAVAL